MEKYATYKVYRNTKTGEVLRIPYGETLELEKYASLDNWIELETDPEDIIEYAEVKN